MDLVKMGHQQPLTPETMDNTASNIITNGKSKIQSNRYEILLGQIHNTTKPFSHILGIGKEKPSRFCHRTPPNMAPYINETNICKSNKKYIENSKYRRTGARRGCAGTTNPVKTRKPDNPLKGIWYLVPNEIHIQWPRGLTVQTQS